MTRSEEGDLFCLILKQCFPIPRAHHTSQRVVAQVVALESCVRPLEVASRRWAHSRSFSLASSHLPSSIINKSVLWLPAEPPMMCMDTKIQSPAFVS